MSSGIGPRCVQPETLDNLPVDDPQAQRSRRDLRRVNWIMGSRSMLLRQLRPALARASAGTPLRLLELGAGDGRLMLRIAQALAPALRTTRRGAAVELQLLDRQSLLDEATCAAFAHLGWHAQPLVQDVLAWADTRGAQGGRYDVIVTNLFLHHFEAVALQALLSAVARHCDEFIACEPRRSRLALSGSQLLFAIGANRVTQHDAVLSVRAGFRARELSALWPADGWHLQEHSAGLFSHLFTASRPAMSATGTA